MSGAEHVAVLQSRKVGAMPKSGSEITNEYPGLLLARELVAMIIRHRHHCVVDTPASGRSPGLLRSDTMLLVLLLPFAFAWFSCTERAFDNPADPSIEIVTPTSVSASALADTAVDLSWTYSGAFQTGFEIQRQVGSGLFATVGTVGASARSYRDGLLLSDGSTYLWRVRAISRYNQSAYASSSMFAASLAPPTGLTVGLTPARALLSWTDNSTIERGFRVEQSTDNITYSVVATAPANATSVSVNGTYVLGTTYYFRIRPFAAVEGSVSAAAAAAVIEGMVFVPGGTFQMGSTSGDSDEQPVHAVTVSSFFMDETEVTYEKWTQVRTWGLTHGYTDLPAGGNGYNGTTNHPVTQVSWYDVVKWHNARSEMEGLTPCYYTDANQTTVYRTGEIALVNGAVKGTANGYRLPTEAEWEYAARGGSRSQGYTYSGSNDLNAVGWYAGNAGSNTHAVKTKGANELGLYDMSGNVWEWVWDWYGTYPSTSQTDPRGPTSGSYRVLRGGSFNNYDLNCRVANRNNHLPTYRVSNLGFRSTRTQ